MAFRIWSGRATPSSTPAKNNTDMIRNEKVVFQMLPGEIVHIECLPQTTMTLEDGRESTRIVKEMIGQKAVPMLCDLTNVVKMTKDCRQHFAGPLHAAVFTKCALIVT